MGHLQRAWGHSLQPLTNMAAVRIVRNRHAPSSWKHTSPAAGPPSRARGVGLRLRGRAGSLPARSCGSRCRRSARARTTTSRWRPRAERAASGFTSASALFVKAKLFDEGLYATVELAAQQGGRDLQREGEPPGRARRRGAPDRGRGLAGRPPGRRRLGCPSRARRVPLAIARRQADRLLHLERRPAPPLPPGSAAAGRAGGAHGPGAGGGAERRPVGRGRLRRLSRSGRPSHEQARRGQAGPARAGRTVLPAPFACPRDRSRQAACSRTARLPMGSASSTRWCGAFAPVCSRFTPADGRAGTSGRPGPSSRCSRRTRLRRRLASA